MAVSPIHVPRRFGARLIPGRRWLFLMHRWLGIGMCILFLLWFISGVVMMYVGYPKLTPTERLAHLPPLSPSEIRISPRDALVTAGLATASEIRLIGNVGGRPAYLLAGTGVAPRGETSQSSAKTIAVFADTGEAAPSDFGREAAMAAAATFGQAEETRSTPRYLELISEDAHTHSKALNAHRPLHLIELPASGLWLYVSSVTGEVVRDASATERFWNYAGAWLHWLYPFRGNFFDAYWHDIVVWLSVAGTILALIGIAVGILRWRFRTRYGNGLHSPYRHGWMRWHHVIGMIFGVITVTWVFSGLMSMNPWKVFDHRQSKADLVTYAGGLIGAAEFKKVPVALLLDGKARELVWSGAGGRHTLLAYHANGRPLLFDPQTLAPIAFEPEHLRASLEQVLDAPIKEIITLREYDTYYYARAEHTMLGHLDKPLPVWRVIYGDGNETWIHVDPLNGAILGRIDATGRLKRWLFAFLHSFDWLPLLERRPLWDVLLLTLSLGGCVLSITGIRIGWRRLQR